MLQLSTMGVESLLEERKNGGRDHVPGKLVERWPKTVESRASGVHLPNGIGDFRKKRVKGALPNRCACSAKEVCEEVEKILHFLYMHSDHTSVMLKVQNIIPP
jgi:hypothetical protein